MGSAQAAGATAIKDVLDNFNYTLSVENNREGALTDLKTSIAGLQADGVSNQALVTYAVSQVKDAQVAAQLKQTLSMVDAGKMSNVEALNLVRDIALKSRAQGANWSGDGTLLYVGLGALLVLAIVLGAMNGCNAEVYDCQYDSYGNDYRDTTFDVIDYWY